MREVVYKSKIEQHRPLSSKAVTPFDHRLQKPVIRMSLYHRQAVPHTRV